MVASIDDAATGTSGTGTISIDNAGQVSGTVGIATGKLAGTAGTGTATIVNSGSINVANGTLIYLGGNVLLDLVSALGQIAELNTNQRAVGSALDAGFNARGNNAGRLGAIFTGNIPQSLTQTSGEIATGSQQTTFDAMNLFMGVITDPFIGGRAGPQAPAGAAGFADEAGGAASTYASGASKRGAAARDAFGLFTKAVPRAYEPRWSVPLDLAGFSIRIAPASFSAGVFQWVF